MRTTIAVMSGMLVILLVSTAFAQDTQCPPCVCPCATPLPPDVQQYSLEMGKIEDPAKPSMFATIEPGYKLVAVEFIISNVAGKPLQVNPMNATLVDTDGFSYRPELAGRDGGGQLPTVTLNQGEKVRGWVAFTVPEEAKPYYIKYDLDLLSGKALQSTAQPE